MAPSKNNNNWTVPSIFAHSAKPRPKKPECVWRVCLILKCVFKSLPVSLLCAPLLPWTCVSRVRLQASLISLGEKQTHQMASEGPLERISRSAENACQAAKFNRPLLWSLCPKDYANLPVSLLFPSPAILHASGGALNTQTFCWELFLIPWILYIGINLSATLGEQQRDRRSGWEADAYVCMCICFVCGGLERYFFFFF